MTLKEKWLTKNVFAIGMTSLFADFGYEMTTAILPIFIISLGGSPQILGLIEGCADASISFIKIFSGWYSDYLGYKENHSLPSVTLLPR